MPKKTIDDLGDLSGKRVLLRVDFNVPLDKNTGAVKNDLYNIESKKNGDVDNAKTIAIIGIIVGAVGLLAGIGGILSGRRKTAT